MMTAIRLELSKAVSRKLSLILMIITTIAFPIIVKIISHLNVIKDGVSEGEFVNNVAFGVIAYSQTYFFLPLWIIIFAGFEFANGHVNRVVFTRSRKFYFSAKLWYCGIITVFFTALGIAAFVIAVNTSPFQQLSFDPIFLFRFILQLAVSTYAFTMVLLALVFIFKSPMITFIVYIGATLVEGIVFSIVQSIYKIELWWLPLHLTRTFYSRNGELALNKYYNPFPEQAFALIIPSIFIFLVAYLTFYFFSRADLKPLSD